MIIFDKTLVAGLFSGNVNAAATGGEERDEELHHDQFWFLFFKRF